MNELFAFSPSHIKTNVTTAPGEVPKSNTIVNCKSIEKEPDGSFFVIVYSTKLHWELMRFF